MDNEGFGYEFSTWSTIEEAMESIGQQMQKRKMRPKHLIGEFFYFFKEYSYAKTV